MKTYNRVLGQLVHFYSTGIFLTDILYLVVYWTERAL